MCSCMKYSTFYKLNVPLLQQDILRVVGVDGGDLGSMGTAELTLMLGMNKVKQCFILCRELRRNIILEAELCRNTVDNK